MPPTTLRIAPQLKKRIDRLAKRLDQSAHRVMLEGIEAAVSSLEASLAWDLELDERQAEFDRTGRAIRHDVMKDWMLALARGQKRAPPTVGRRR